MPSNVNDLEMVVYLFFPLEMVVYRQLRDIHEKRIGLKEEEKQGHNTR
jgi:hypothetical protein